MAHKILYRGAVYRRAAAFPDWDSVWTAFYRKYPDIVKEERERAGDYEDYLDLEDIALSEGLITQEDLEAYQDRASLPRGERREIEIAYDDAMLSAEDAWHADPYVTLSMVESRYEDLYDNLMAGLASLRTVWRSVRLAKDVDPTTVDPLGIYWARKASGAESYWGWKATNGQDVVYRAEGEFKYVDIDGTIEANLTPGFGDQELEIRFLPGSPLYVLDVTLPDGSVVPINAVRKA